MLKGKYAIKYKGRGLIYVYLTPSQYLALAEIVNSGQMEFESIEKIDD